MRIILLGVLVGVLTGLAPNALGELYRWRDPQTGSIKYSTYPPPWFGDAAREARSPKVEVLSGERDSAAAKSTPVDAMAEKVAEVIQFMEKRREQLLARMTVARASSGFKPSDAAFQQDLQAYRAVSRELDKFDLKGATARRAADARVFENLGVATQEAQETRAPVAGERPPPAAGPGFRSGAETTPVAPGAPPSRSAGQPQPGPVDRADRPR